MNNKEFKTLLKEALRQTDFSTDKKHFESTLLLAKKEAHQTQMRKRISFTQFLAAQIRFIGWKIWAAQGLFLLAFHTVLSRFYGPEQPRHIPGLLFCLSVLVLMTALPFLYRSVRYQMQEVESASRFSLVKLLTAKLTLIGIGDLLMLIGIFLITLWETSLSAESIFISLCFPFLSACSGCLFMLGHLNPKKFLAGSLGLCSLLLLLAALFPRHYEAVFLSALPEKWFAVCTLLLLICIRECRYIVHCSSYTEMQLT